MSCDNTPGAVVSNRSFSPAPDEGILSRRDNDSTVKVIAVGASLALLGSALTMVIRSRRALVASSITTDQVATVPDVRVMADVITGA